MTRAVAVRARAALMAALLSASFGGCDPSEPCDPGYYVEHGACYENPVVEDAGGDAQVDEDDDGGALSADAAPATDPYEGFGEPCQEQSQCPGDLVCGAPQLPMCTQVNCLDDDSVCPPDWTCYDTMGASPDPSVTSVCLML